MKLEIIGFNIESCIAAQEAGANRIELCAAPGEGGTTPSYAFIKAAREKLNIDLYVMIRPRGGDFLFSDDDFNIMKNDIAICKETGCDGIVTGILTKDGKPDKKRCKELIDLAYPLEATFHRAFDRVNNPSEALEDIIDLGFERILTSGLKPKAIEGVPLISQLIQQSDGRIIIMPGSGVNSENIISIAENTGASEFHSSASILKESEMEYTNPEMNESLQYVTVNKEEVKKMIKLLNG
ncbi:MAG TPA: copper homeostasis protein CutC [Hanamia sp.]|nr:copper homeostasis protein CutC [Hanamia sp.]